MLLFSLIVAAGWPLPDTLAGLSRKSFGQSSAEKFVAMQKKDPYHARVYLDCGLVSVNEADYGGEWVTVFMLKSPVAALCAYGHDKTLDSHPLPVYDAPQSEANTQPGSAHLWRGNVYVRIRGKSGAAQMALLDALAKTIASPNDPDPTIERVRKLPASERIPGSDRFVARNVFGWNAFARGYSVDYACGDGALSIANIELPMGQSAEKLAQTALAEAKARAYSVAAFVPKRPPAQDEDVTAAPLPKLMMQALPPAKGSALYVLVGVAGERLVAIDSDTPLDACLPLVDELLRMLADR